MTWTVIIGSFHVFESSEPRVPCRCKDVFSIQGLQWLTNTTSDLKEHLYSKRDTNFDNVMIHILWLCCRVLQMLYILHLTINMQIPMQPAHCTMYSLQEIMLCLQLCMLSLIFTDQSTVAVHAWYDTCFTDIHCSNTSIPFICYHLFIHYHCGFRAELCIPILHAM